MSITEYNETKVMIKKANDKSLHIQDVTGASHEFDNN